MSVDWEGITEIVDNIDTQWAVRGSLSSSNLDDLSNVLDQIRPYLTGYGSQQDTNNALKFYHKIHQMMGRDIGGSSETSTGGESDVDTTTCHLCGEQHSGTPEELDAWELKHVKENHPEVRIPNP